MCCSLLKEKLNAKVSVVKNHIYKIFFCFLYWLLRLKIYLFGKKKVVPFKFTKKCKHINNSNSEILAWFVGCKEERQLCKSKIPIKYFSILLNTANYSL